ncbi:hypothetical protein F7725_020025 [Dissostichus mawsoni]|uniref:Alpha-2-macroglobulin domain-containing protein n=1 Tax=Dissostichus mawsoni TaxID=36200 RepID=A0A7J5YLD7_DISMA|nr:hypothetical protein F7725_020025 [Dissostichus mawsoni]
MKNPREIRETEEEEEEERREEEEEEEEEDQSLFRYKDYTCLLQSGSLWRVLLFLQMDLLQVWGFFGFICFTAAVNTTRSPEPSYLLLAPRSLRPGVATTLSVSLLTRSSSVNVSALIRYKDLIFSSNSTIIPESESSYWSTYQLEVKGHRGSEEVFSNSAQLHFNPKGSSTFLQTDRSSYLPGQVVKIRAVSVLPDGKPLQRPLNISINIDILTPDVINRPGPRGNLLRQWLDVEGVLGVVSTDENGLTAALFQIDGEADFLYEVPDYSYRPRSKRRTEMFYPRYMEDSLEIIVNVTEHLTGLTYSSTTNVTLAKYKYESSFQDHPKTLRPSLMLPVTLKISTYNDEPLSKEDQRKTVKVSVMQRKRNPWSWWFTEIIGRPRLKEEEKMVVEEMEFPVPADGLIPLNIQIKNDTETLTIDAFFEDSHSTLQLYSIYRSPSHSYLQIKTPDPPQVMSRGQVVSAGKSSGVIVLFPESTWAPVACIIVYCVHPSGEIVNNVMHLPITQTLQNQVLKEMKEYGTCDLVVLTDATLNMRYPLRPPFREEMIGMEVFKYDDSNMDHGVEPRERWNFPETWIWMDKDTGDSDSADITLTAPDSITTWEATAFVMSENLGLGIVNMPAKLTVFQDFFLSLNVPSYIIRGEELLLEIVLFNYLSQDLEVRVIVAESDTFEFVFPDNGELLMPNVRKVSVGSQRGASVLIPIRPLVLGEISVSVKALSAAASDMVTKTVLVKAEGLEQSFSSSMLLEVSPSQPSVSREISFSFPADVVEGSERATVTVGGDILGPSISGLGSLIKLPSGCGEQNMINFAPNIFVLQYLSAGAAVWLRAQQGKDGRYLEPGRVIHSGLQGGLDGPVSLTAYVLIALLEDSDIRAEYNGHVSSALEFLETRLALGVSSNYSLSLLCYALALRRPMWSSSDAGVSSSWQPLSADIEMLSYVLLTQHKLGLITDGIKIMKWLGTQRNHLGGYGTTQDTVVALQALSTFAAGRTHDIELIVTVETDDSTPDVSAEGRGLALIQLNVFYNIRSDETMMRRRGRRNAEDHEAFHLNQNGLQTDDLLKKVETQPGKVILYLDSITAEEECFTIPLVLEYKDKGR